MSKFLLATRCSVGNPFAFTFNVFPQCIFFVLDSYRQWWTKVACFCHCIQGALGKQDLGRLHHKPVKDRNGSTLIVAVNYVIVSKFLVVVKLQRNWTFGGGCDIGQVNWLTDGINEWINERTKEETNKWIREWYTNWLTDGINEWMNERTNKRASESTRDGSALVSFSLCMQQECMNTWMIYWLTDLINEWTNEQPNERASESTRDGSALVRFRLNMQEVSY